MYATAVDVEPRQKDICEVRRLVSHDVLLIAFRFLYIRQLILRPALEAFFKKQQSTQASLNRTSKDTGLEDLMLGRIAAECVMLAVTLIETLNAHIKLYDFMAWWLNVSCRLCV